MRRALALPVVVDNQIARQPHQPILQVSLFSVVLFQRSIDSYENFLRQILGCFCSRSESVSEVIDSSGVRMNNVFPGRAIPGATLANQLGSFVGSQSSCSPHLFSPPACVCQRHSRCRGTSPKRRNYDSLKRKVPDILERERRSALLKDDQQAGCPRSQPTFLLRVMNCSSLRPAQYLVVYFPNESSGLLILEVYYPKIR